MSCTDICEILRAASESGVRHFAFKGLEFTIGGSIPLAPVSNLYDAALDYVKEVEDTKEELNEDPFDLGDLAITDPEEYERLLLDGAEDA